MALDESNLQAGTIPQLSGLPDEVGLVFHQRYCQSVLGIAPRCCVVGGETEEIGAGKGVVEASQLQFGWSESKVVPWIYGP